MSKDQAIGAAIVAVTVILAVAFIGLLFFYDPYIACWLNLGASADVRFWLIAAPVTIAFVAILAIGAWIGYTMATTPAPKPIEEMKKSQPNLKQKPKPPNHKQKTSQKLNAPFFNVPSPFSATWSWRAPNFDSAQIKRKAF